MICFIRESHEDTLIYYPIIKKLEDRKLKYVVYDAEGKTTIDAIHFFSQNPTITRVINYGGSVGKLSIAVLCQEHGMFYVNLQGNGCGGNTLTESIYNTISTLASHNFVSSDLARMFLIDKGIETPIGFFECPITHFSRKSKVISDVDVLYVGTDSTTISKHEKELRHNKYKYKIFDISNGLPDDWKDIYAHMKSAKLIVSDLFVFDKPSRYLNKHFFYIGSNVTDAANLGVSTHLVTKKFELHDYLKQSWSTLTDINQKWGLEPLMNLL